MAERKRRAGHGEAKDLITRSYADFMRKEGRRPKRAELEKAYPELADMKRSLERYYPKLRKMSPEELGVSDFQHKVNEKLPERPKGFEPSPGPWLKDKLELVQKLKDRFAMSPFVDDLQAWSSLTSVGRELQKSLIKIQVGILDKEQVRLVSWHLVQKWINKKKGIEVESKKAKSRGFLDLKTTIYQVLWEYECQIGRLSSTYDPQVIYVICGLLRYGSKEVLSLEAMEASIGEEQMEASHKFYQQMIAEMDVDNFLKKKYEELKNDGKLPKPKTKSKFTGNAK